MNPLPTVSIVIPCRNEGRFIAKCLESVINNGYPADRLEIIVIDGMSDDDTRSIIQRHSDRNTLIKIVDNPKKVTPFALNIGIGVATGEIIMRLDAHTVCERDYIFRCVEALNKYDADDVGGLWHIVARDNTPVGRAIVKALTTRLGVGNVRHRLSKSEEPEIVDTVPFFCCRREVFQKVGLFNERLTRIQDMEFKRRLVRTGGKIMLVPGAATSYQARSDLKSFVRHNWADGLWTVLAFAHSDVMPVRWRHLAPACLMGALIGSGLLAIGFPFFLWAFVGIAGIYLLATFALSAKVALAERDIRYLFLIPLAVAILHGMRGLGSLWGIMRLIAGRKVVHAIHLVLREQHA
ncbi:MAG TPA: glycosyltransferase [Bryobacteraceae bacterium]|nr:glycosyltransferase [Bryobacteraceae bacterium]